MNRGALGGGLCGLTLGNRESSPGGEEGYEKINTR